VRAERVFPIPPLALPDPLGSLGEILEAESVQLFAERARSIRPGFALDESNAATVAEICLRLDGLPLAIELAAARLAVFTPAELLARLQERLDVLGAGGRDLPDRQRTLWGAIGWSYELLTEPERSLFQVLSVFSGCDLLALESVAGGQVPGDVIGLLGEGLDGVDVLAGEVEHGPAGHEQGEAGSASEKLAERRGRLVQMLGVVEHEQELPGTQERGQGLERLVAVLLNCKSAHDRAENDRGIAQRRQLDERGAVRKRRRGGVGSLEREPGLAGAPGTRQDEQPHVLAQEELAQLNELAFATEQRVRSRRKVRDYGLLRAYDVEARVLLEDAPLELAHLAARLEP
jgi:hypothetical protein